MKRMILLSLLFLTACSRSYLSVQKQRVGRSSLASTFVQSPDPLQKDPPAGQRLLVKWRLPSSELAEGLRLQLKVIYKNYSEELYEDPVTSENGLLVYNVLGERYRETGGYLTYRAQIVDSEAQVIKNWQQQLWVEIIEPPPLELDPFVETAEPTEPGFPFPPNQYTDQ